MTNASGTIVYVDADACPVKGEVATIAIRHGCRAVMVCNGGIRPHPHPLIDLAIVNDGQDAADIWIADHAGAQDVVVTNDIPLAARVVENGAAVLRPDGSPVSADNVGYVLATRDLMTDMRASDPFRKAKGRPFSKADRGRFSQALDQLLSRAAARG